MRDRTGGGNRSGQFTFDRTYTRQFSDESSLTPSNLGLALAAFELGLPTSASINDEATIELQQLLDGGVRPGHLAARQADAQRAACASNTRRACARTNGHMIVGFDPTAQQSRSPTPRRRPTSPAACRTRPACRRHSASLGGPIYASDSGSRASPGQAMWMPRASASYLLGERTVLKGGYGLYYDTLTAADYFAAQAGYSVTTTSTISDDLGRTFKWATPATGGGEFRSVPGTRRRHALGSRSSATRSASTRFSAGRSPPKTAQREHARQQRWRVSLQRRAVGETRRRSRLHRRVQRPAADQHPRRLPAGAVPGTAATRATPPRTRS